ncbi:YdcF family protein [Dyadobacter subterraneus]|uniref:YdcF family protein n=1 Tax=Dyadobacter subterraneus TaxID=2773304 RepID=A0ABR9WFJ4_9BACT|nr:YdcF family protein [Dyadobacter subterraneus]MBE9464277.1 YdcF family protein [Dyadobacter subterraneus]
MKIILVLGSPNEPDGTLSEMAKSRLKFCQNLYRSGTYKIVLTGGYGPHFNTTDKPHAYYLQQALISQNVKEEDILALVESRHSVEDATLSKWIITKYQPEEIIIITSDYHFERAKMVFDAVYAPFMDFSFSLASSENVDPETLNLLIQHEKIALQDLIDHGVRF